jgi:hypothetical protein
MLPKMSLRGLQSTLGTASLKIGIAENTHNNLTFVTPSLKNAIVNVPFSTQMRISSAGSPPT